MSKIDKFTRINCEVLRKSTLANLRVSLRRVASGNAASGYHVSVCVCTQEVNCASHIHIRIHRVCNSTISVAQFETQRNVFNVCCNQSQNQYSFTVAIQSTSVQQVCQSVRTQFKAIILSKATSTSLTENHGGNTHILSATCPRR